VNSVLVTDRNIYWHEV